MKGIFETLTFIIKQRKVRRKRKNRLLVRLRKGKPLPKSPLGAVWDFFCRPFAIILEFLFEGQSLIPHPSPEMRDNFVKARKEKKLNTFEQAISDELDSAIAEGYKIGKEKEYIPTGASRTLQDYLDKEGYQQRRTIMRAYVSGLNNNNSFFAEKDSKPVMESLAMELRQCYVEVKFEKSVRGYNAYRTIRNYQGDIIESYNISVPEFTRYLFDRDIKDKMIKLFELPFNTKNKEYDFLK